MKIFLLALAVVGLAVEASPSQPLPIAQCAEHVPYGRPKSPKKDTTAVCRPGYILEHDNKAKIPRWVSYVLTPAEAQGCFPRKSNFVADPYLPAEAAASPKSYAKSGYDIGHLASAADMQWSAQAEEDSTVTSNGAPQLKSLNRGSWKSLEIRTRGWAIGRDTPLAITVGTIGNETTLTGGVVVPKAFYKVLVDTQTKEVLAFIYEQGGTRGTPDKFLTSLAEVQRRAGYVIPMPTGAKLGGPIWPVTASSIRSKVKTCSKV